MTDDEFEDLEDETAEGFSAIDEEEIEEEIDLDDVIEDEDSSDDDEDEDLLDDDHDDLDIPYSDEE